MTSAEYGRFKTEVRKTYLSESEYIRRKLLHPQMRIRSREETDLLNFVIGSLSQVNNNINQIARKRGCCDRQRRSEAAQPSRGHIEGVEYV